MSQNNQYLIFLIDDNPAILELLQLLLEWEGFRTYSCEQSSLVIEQIHQLHPNLLILDVMMPPPDGWTILKDLRQSPQTADIPVILMSAGSFNQFNIPPGLTVNQGNTRAVSKPFDNAHLLNLINELLTNRNPE